MIISLSAFVIKYASDLPVYDELMKELDSFISKLQRDDLGDMGPSSGYRPSDFIKARTSVFLDGNEGIVEKECDFLIRTFPVNDVWPVSWCWFDNAKLYPQEEIISLHVAKARKCIERMLFLKGFNCV